MTYQPFYIASLKSGLVKNPEAFLLPQDAFPFLENAYIFRERILRKAGYTLLDRLCREISSVTLGDTQANGASTTIPDLLDDSNINVRSPAPPEVAQPNAAIKPGTVTIIVDPGGGSQTTFTDVNKDGTLSLSAGPLTISSASINYATGEIIFNWSPAIVGPFDIEVTFFYCPALPCMGLRVLEIGQVNQEELIGFDQVYAYRYNVGAGRFEQAGSATWKGSDSQFFWTTNYYQDGSNNDLFWATNFNAGGGAGTNDPLRFYNGTSWTDFAPSLDGAGTELHQARMLIPYKDRLLAFNTWEGATLDTSVNFPQRVRFSQNGDPTDTTNGWRSDIAGRGGFIDAPTNERIISTEFIRDILVVGFERSTWQLRYTGNEILPFIWERINSELGTESTFSMIRFDTGVISIGEVSLHACDGNNVKRIDLQIPDEILSIHNLQQGSERVYGIRDLTLQNVYWTVPEIENSRKFPQRMLVYNYLNNTYALWNDHYTCFGKWQSDETLRWSDLNDPHAHQWQNWDKAWNWGGGQAFYPKVVGGNQQGFVEILNEGSANDVSLQIVSISNTVPVQISSPDHNLETNNIITLSNILDPNGFATALNDKTFKVLRIDDDTFSLLEYDFNLNAYLAVSLGGVPDYLGNGTITLLSNFKISSKRFNVYEIGRRSDLGYIDFLTNTTPNGQFTCEIYINDNSTESLNTGFVSLPSDPTSFFNALVDTSSPIFKFPNSAKNWHRFYCHVKGDTYQYLLKLNDVQMNTELVQESPLSIFALILWQKDGGRLVL